MKLKKHKILLIFLSLIAAFLIVAGLVWVNLHGSSVRRAQQTGKFDSPSTFLAVHENELKQEIFHQLDPKKQHIHKIELFFSSAQGSYDNGGDVGGMYHISFQAFANGKTRYQISGQLDFPKAAIGPFTFVTPDPYKHPADLEVYDLSLDETDTSFSDDEQNKGFWAWKVAQDKAKADAEARKEAAQAAAQAVKDKKTQQLATQWFAKHHDQLIDALNKANKNIAQTGKIVSLTYDGGFSQMAFISGHYDVPKVTITFSQKPNEKIQLYLDASFDDDNFSDLSKSAEFSVAGYDSDENGLVSGQGSDCGFTKGTDDIQGEHWFTVK